MKKFITRFVVPLLIGGILIAAAGLPNIGKIMEHENAMATGGAAPPE